MSAERTADEISESMNDHQQSIDLLNDIKQFNGAIKWHYEKIKTFEKKLYEARVKQINHKMESLRKETRAACNIERNRAWVEQQGSR